jgi:hypothetical protein
MPVTQGGLRPTLGFDLLPLQGSADDPGKHIRDRQHDMKAEG